MATMTEDKRDVRTLATHLVRQWYLDIPGVEMDPPYREVSQAVELLEHHGVETILQAYPRLIEKMRRDFKDSLRWGGAEIHWRIVLRDLYRERARAEQRQAEAEKRNQPDPVKENDEVVQKRWEPVWNRLPKEEQSKIEAEVKATHPFAGNIPNFLRVLCLKRLAERHQ